MYSLILGLALLGCPVADLNSTEHVSVKSERDQMLNEVSHKEFIYKIKTSFVDHTGKNIEDTGTLHISQNRVGTVACIENAHNSCESLQDYSIFIPVDKLLSALLFDEHVLPFGEQTPPYNTDQPLFHGLLTISDNISQKPQDVTVSYHDFLTVPVSNEQGMDIKDVEVPLVITGTIEQTRLPQKVQFGATLKRIILKE